MPQLEQWGDLGMDLELRARIDELQSKVLEMKSDEDRVQLAKDIAGVVIDAAYANGGLLGVMLIVSRLRLGE